VKLSEVGSGPVKDLTTGRPAWQQKRMTKNLETNVPKMGKYWKRKILNFNWRKIKQKLNDTTL
jgi:hypothetical protein